MDSSMDLLQLPAESLRPLTATQEDGFDRGCPTGRIFFSPREKLPKLGGFRIFWKLRPKSELGVSKMAL